MPALTVCGKRWLVGTDDFVAPALVAILIRLVCVAFTVGILVYLFLGPPECLDEYGKAETIPPLLYGSLFALLFILSLSIFNENIIFSISIKGDILDTKDKRKGFTFWLFVRIGLIMIEVLSVMVCTYAVFGREPHAAGALECQEYHDGPLVFAKVVVVMMLITQLVYMVGFFIFVDPLGLCCTPSILPEMNRIESYANKTQKELEEEESSYAKKSRLGHLHRSHVGYRSVVKKVKSLLCCLDANGNRSRQTAMKEMALALHTLFSNDNRVPSDLVAGLVLVSRHQKVKKKACRGCSSVDAVKCPCLFKGLKKLTFDHMPENHRPNGFTESDSVPPSFFDPSKAEERLLLEELIHYMRYSMGIYGWPLHVFDKPCCGICEICSVTCCLCKFRSCHPLAQPDPEMAYPRVMLDDCCMSGLGTVRLRSDLEEAHILYINYQNEVFQAPFSICYDHNHRAIVLTVRGTLSIKDAMTDLSVSMVDVEEKYKNPDVEGKQCVHVGMYITAKYIYDTLETQQLLARAFQGEHKDYRFVITGHSLGAGVASVLSVMLKQYYPDLRCYAFSPPGCIFSFPLAHYSRNFITSVVLGNDMIPRVTFRSLLYLKRQMDFLVKNCHHSKFQVLFRPRFLDRLPLPLRQCLFGDKKDPIMDPTIFHGEIEEKLKAGHEKDRKRPSLHGVVGNVLRTKKLASRWRTRSRQLKDTLHGFVEGVEEGTLVASFPPGKIVHIQVEYSKKPWLLHYCYPDTLGLCHVSGEDLCVIVVDRGMVDDHLPNNVLRALERCQKEIVGRQYSSDEVTSLRKSHATEIDQAIAQRKPFGKVITRERVASVPSSSGIYVIGHHPDIQPPAQTPGSQITRLSSSSNFVSMLHSDARVSQQPTSTSVQDSSQDRNGASSWQALKARSAGDIAVEIDHTDADEDKSIETMVTTAI